MKKCLSVSKYFTIAFIFMIAGTLEAQSVLSWDFESNNIGDTFNHIGWSPTDIQSVVSDDPVASGNNVLKNTVHNYNAAPVLMFVLPVGKTLADYDTLTFKGYFQKGDVGYKGIVAQAYQIMPTGHFLDTDTLGLYNRAMGTSTEWENISLNISNISSFSDTVYIALGINCAGTSGSDTTTWYADDIQLVEKPAVVGPMLGTEQDFETYSLGDSLSTIGWTPTDIQSVVVDDPLNSGNNVLQNTIHNYNAAPVLTFVLPDGKTLADYDSLTFKGYFQKGDVAYKYIVAQVYQTKPTGHFLDTDTLGLYNRAQGVSVDWENISLSISNFSAFSDTIYIALGINCAGTANNDTTTWYADDITLVAKVDTTTYQVVTNGGFEDSDVGDVDSITVKGWLFLVADGITPLPEFEIVDDIVQEGSHALKVTVQGLGTNQWDTQVVADSLHVTPGVAYNYSIWAKAETPGAQVNFTIGSYTLGEYGAIRPANLTTSWSEYKMTFTVSNNETYIRGPIHFNYAANVGNNIYIDNLQIVAIIPDTNVYQGPPLATNQPKFVGNIYSAAQIENFESYWNEVTPENAGKWGSVEGTRDNMNWSGLDAAYNLAKDNEFPFNFHVLIWGAQQPAWIDSLQPAEQLEEIREWFQAVADRYGDIDYLQVVNEPLPGHNPPDGTNGRANYKEALGGNGETGWDWVLNAFRMAREIFPEGQKLMINDFNIINSSSSTASYLNLIRLLQSENLIDVIGEQGHSFTTTATVVTIMIKNLDSLATTGLPIQITELDISGASDAIQLQNYQRIFPTLYEHPGVEGITLWGWRPGLWTEGANLLNENGSERPAMVWLRDYLDTVDVTVGVNDIAESPNEFHLDNNYPNPFNPTTNIRYSIANPSKVTLKVYDVLGKEVQTLVNEEKSPGQYTVTFNAQNLASGIYFYQINAGSFTATKKLMLLK